VSVVSMRELLEAGVHFGHQTRRWNPKMRRFLFTERGGIYIIDLQQTLELLEQAHAFVRNVAARGGSVLFVGTKKQCQDSIAEQATRVGMPYVNHRWLGGLLTNWRTISNRLERLEELRRLREDGHLELLPAKERISMLAELEKLETNLGGVQDMKDIPDVVFVVDLKKEQLAIREARRLGIPVVALVDTNCDPDDADLVVPGNDDAISSCSLVTRVIADGVAHGQRGVSEQELAEGNGRPPDEPRTEERRVDAAAEYGSETAALAEEALGEQPAAASVPAATGDAEAGEPGGAGTETAAAGEASGGATETADATEAAGAAETADAAQPGDATEPADVTTEAADAPAYEEASE
jgi:small subunit ribosomal protein S2